MDCGGSGNGGAPMFGIEGGGGGGSCCFPNNDLGLGVGGEVVFECCCGFVSDFITCDISGAGADCCCCCSSLGNNGVGICATGLDCETIRWSFSSCLISDLANNDLEIGADAPGGETTL